MKITRPWKDFVILSNQQSKMTHIGKRLIAIFRDFSACINNIFTLAVGMGTRLLFYEA